MSTINETTEQKIKCVTRAKADIIFLNSDNQIVVVNNLTKKFKFFGVRLFSQFKRAK